MMCPVCSAIPGEGECAECRALAEEMQANAEALAALRDENLPPMMVKVPRRAPAYSWIAAAAAAILLAIALPRLRQSVQTTPQAALTPGLPAAAQARSEPLKIKFLTQDPDVVIYWLIDSKEGE